MAYTKNYYHVLGLDVPGSASGLGVTTAQPKSTQLRRAYRRALLAAHPDKQAPATAGGQAAQYSVDDVKEAYRVLDDPAARAAYDEWALRNPHAFSLHDGHGPHAQTHTQTLSADFILGLDVLDLSEFEELDGLQEGEVQWRRACRCGDQVGFCVGEGELERAEREGEREVLVGCGGCSLWVRVGFEVEEG